MQLKELQAHIRQQDHRPELAHAYFEKLIEEVGELARALRKGRIKDDSADRFKGTAAEELYDVLYYVCALANIHEIDLEHAHVVKSRLNDVKYGRTPANASLDSFSSMAAE